jgi:hypothetical protein
MLTSDDVVTVDDVTIRRRGSLVMSSLRIISLAPLDFEHPLHWY